MQNPSSAEELQALIKQHSIPEERVRSNEFAGARHIGVVFNDGEYSSTKAGDLLWQRGLHLFQRGHELMRLPKEWFPYEMNGFGFVYTLEGDQLHEAIMNYFKKSS